MNLPEMFSTTQVHFAAELNRQNGDRCDIGDKETVFNDTEQCKPPKFPRMTRWSSGSSQCMSPLSAQSRSQDSVQDGLESSYQSPSSCNSIQWHRPSENYMHFAGSSQSPKVQTHLLPPGCFKLPANDRYGSHAHLPEEAGISYVNKNNHYQASSSDGTCVSDTPRNNLSIASIPTDSYRQDPSADTADVNCISNPMASSVNSLWGSLHPSVSSGGLVASLNAQGAGSSPIPWSHPFSQNVPQGSSQHCNHHFQKQQRPLTLYEQHHQHSRECGERTDSILPPFDWRWVEYCGKIYPGELRSPAQGRSIYALSSPWVNEYQGRQVMPRPGPSIELTNSHLWREFHQMTCEMIITKSGRRMFPTLNVQLHGLEPSRRYNVYVDMVLADKSHLKFSQGRWQPSGQTEDNSQVWPPAGKLPVTGIKNCLRLGITRHGLISGLGLLDCHYGRVYVHPDSPSTGEYWMKREICFSKLKLTNNRQDSSGHIIVSSMHNYQPRVHVMAVKEGEGGVEEVVVSAIYPETQFIAVTAYQNCAVTTMKICHNPFAKGFRDNNSEIPPELRRRCNGLSQYQFPQKVVVAAQPMVPISKYNNDQRKVTISPPYTKPAKIDPSGSQKGQRPTVLVTCPPPATQLISNKAADKTTKVEACNQTTSKQGSDSQSSSASSPCKKACSTTPCKELPRLSSSSSSSANISISVSFISGGSPSIDATNTAASSNSESCNQLPFGIERFTTKRASSAFSKEESSRNSFVQRTVENSNCDRKTVNLNVEPSPYKTELGPVCEIQETPSSCRYSYSGHSASEIPTTMETTFATVGDQRSHITYLDKDRFAMGEALMMSLDSPHWKSSQFPFRHRPLENWRQEQSTHTLLPACHVPLPSPPHQFHKPTVTHFLQPPEQQTDACQQQTLVTSPLQADTAATESEGIYPAFYTHRPTLDAGCGNFSVPQNYYTKALTDYSLPSQNGLVCGMNDSTPIPQALESCTSFETGFSTLAQNTWNSFSTPAQNTWSSFCSPAQNTWSSFCTPAQNTWSSLSTPAQNTWSSFSTPAQNTWSTFSTPAQNTWSSFEDAPVSSPKTLTLLQNSHVSAQDAYDLISKSYLSSSLHEEEPSLIYSG